MTTLPRDVLKWLQSLDLSHPARNTRRDFSNGYLIAEIFSWYFPQDIQMHSFANGASIETKVGNWSILQRFFQRQGFNFPQQEIDGTIHCKPGAASLLVQRIYSSLTNRTIPTLPNEDLSFTDRQYQVGLPLHARSTASQAIKNNIANSELFTDPDRILSQKKAQDIIKGHVEHRQEERRHDPKRFGIKPSLCEKSMRRLPKDASNGVDKGTLVRQDGYSENEYYEDRDENYKEIQVTQSDAGLRNSLYQQRNVVYANALH